MLESIAPSNALLSSQQQVCERLVYLTRFSSVVAFIAGCEGAGKTSIAQQYLDLQADGNQCLITSKINNEAYALRQQIISQLYPNIAFDSQMSLCEILKYKQCLEKSSQNLLIVIDDAQHLPTEILRELWQLQQENYEAGYPNQINILLFGLPQWCSQSHHLLESEHGEAPLELDIPPLDDEEALCLAQYHISQAGLNNTLDTNSSELQKILQAEELTPGLIFSYLFPQNAENKNKKTDKKSLKQGFSELNLKAIAVSLLVILIVVINGIYQHNSSQQGIFSSVKLAPSQEPSKLPNKEVSKTRPEKQEKAKAETKATEKKIAPLPTAQLAARWPKHQEDKGLIKVLNLPKIRAFLDSKVSHRIAAQDPTSTKVQKITTVETSFKFEIVSWEDAAQHQKAIDQSQQSNKKSAEAKTGENKATQAKQPSPKQLSLKEEKAIVQPASNTQEQTKTTADVTEIAQQSKVKKPLKAAETKTQPPKNQHAEQTKAKIEANNKIKTPVAKPKNQVEELKNKPNKRYTIQLAGLSSRAQVKQFIANHQLQDKVWTYKTIRNNRPWYVVIMGDYISLEESREVIESLPLSLRSQSPWAKSFFSVKKEIKLSTKGQK